MRRQGSQSGCWGQGEWAQGWGKAHEEVHRCQWGWLTGDFTCFSGSSRSLGHQATWVCTPNLQPAGSSTLLISRTSTFRRTGRGVGQKGLAPLPRVPYPTGPHQALVPWGQAVLSGWQDCSKKWSQKWALWGGLLQEALVWV